jgi:hypothetical protein
MALDNKPWNAGPSPFAMRKLGSIPPLLHQFFQALQPTNLTRFWCRRHFTRTLRERRRPDAKIFKCHKPEILLRRKNQTARMSTGGFQQRYSQRYSREVWQPTPSQTTPNLKALRFPKSCVSSSCRLLSRSEEGSQGRSELFLVRGVHRSAA